jgi:hypothetical protein
MSSSSSSNITMTGPDYDKSHVEVGRGRAEYHFRLSATPSERWVEIFDQKWADYRRRRAEEAGTPTIVPNACAEDSDLVLSCALHDDRLQSHLDELKRIVAETNKALREEETEYKAKEEEYKQLILNNLVKLNFD